MIKLMAKRLNVLHSHISNFSTTEGPTSLSKQAIIKSKLEIIGKKTLNHDSYIYYLKWAGPKFRLNIGQHFRIVEHIPTWEHPQGEEVIKKYTPISPCSQEDLLEMLIKIYRPNENPDFPHGGKLTPYLEKLKIGEHINVDGPFGKFGYKQGGVLVLNGKQFRKKRIFFMAGGSGITPCYQTIKQIIKMPSEKIQLVLLFANKKQQDIVLRKQIEDMIPRVNVYYTLDVAPQRWNHLSGYATKEMLEKICPLDDPDTAYIHCGPKGMNTFIRNLFAKHFPSSTLFKY